MCSNYRPVTRIDRLLTFFGVERNHDEPSADIFPLGLAPFIRLRHQQDPGADDAPCHLVEDGIFGLLPHFASEVAYGRKTYNARSETVAVLASFKQAWRAGQRCIIPSECIFEPNWETGRAVRWRIGQAGDVPMGIAGIYATWRHPDGREMATFAMLTVNADEHPVMRRFHRPGEEKRMVVILQPSDYGSWLSCSVAEAPRFLRLWDGPLDASPEPLPPRPPSAASARTARPRSAPAEDTPPKGSTGDLFS
ncbi:MAG: SOS response-associated peptidase family protein [Caldimonas sp.]